MDKKELRPVRYERFTSSHARFEKMAEDAKAQLTGKKSEPVYLNGHFHQWIKKDEVAFALVEEADGQMVSIHHDFVKFEDRVEKEPEPI